MEVELKFIIDREEADRIWKRAIEAGLVKARPRARQLVSTYYDTEARALRELGIALRLRRDGKTWRQTVKQAREHHGGLQRVEELEVKLKSGTIDLAAFGDADTEKTIRQAIGDAPLEPIHETRMKRASTVVTAGNGARVELAVDLGEIRAGDRVEPFNEVEFELFDGPLGGLFDVAGTLLAGADARYSRRSKAARADLLASEGRVISLPVPRKSRPIVFANRWTAEKAVRTIMRECVDQIITNIDTVRRNDDPEGPHQLRVGLRRLRSAFSVFSEALDCPEMHRLHDEARWLGQVVGRLRDVDVVLIDMIEPAIATEGADAGMPELAEQLKVHIATVRAEVREVLATPRVRKFELDILRYVETRAWRDNAGGKAPRLLTAPVKMSAERQLHKRYRKVKRCARNLANLTIEQRHELRKQLKKLRYAAEFFAPLYSQKKSASFLTHLKSLQTVFGDLNDAAVLRGLFNDPDAAHAFSEDVQRAIGWMVGVSEGRAALAWQDAVGLWTEFKATPRFWR